MHIYIMYIIYYIVINSILSIVLRVHWSLVVHWKYIGTHIN